MRKEVIVAVFLGGLIGVILAFGVWRARGVFDRKPDVAQDTQQTAESVEVDEVEGTPITGLTVLSPSADLAIVGASPLTISGMTVPGTAVIASNGESTDVSLAGSDGAYEAEIELQNGLNEILVGGVLADAISEQVKVRVVFSEGEPTGGQSAAGVITDIVEGALQIRDETGTIQQVSLSEDAEYENQINETQELDFEDVAIGDFVLVEIALPDAENVADKVIVMNPPEENLIRIVFGEVLTLNNDEFILRDVEQDWSLDATGGRVSITSFDEDGAVVDTRLAEVIEGDKIIVVGELVDEEIDVSRIHLVKL